MARQFTMAAVLLACSQIAHGEGPTPINFNDRGFACEAFDYAELASIESDELERIHCSAQAGAEFSFTRAERAPASDVYRTIAANKEALRKSDACMKIIRTSRDIAARKFKDTKFRCDEYTAKAKQMANNFP